MQVEAGYHTIERQAWRYCHTLTIVKLPSSVVAIANAAFQGCYALTTVATPGCVSLGARLFAERRALEQVGVLTENFCRLARGATVSPYAFEGCEKLVQIGLPSIKVVTDTYRVYVYVAFWRQRKIEKCNRGKKWGVETTRFVASKEVCEI